MCAKKPAFQMYFTASLNSHVSKKSPSRPSTVGQALPVPALLRADAPWQVSAEELEGGTFAGHGVIGGTEVYVGKAASKGPCAAHASLSLALPHARSLPCAPCWHRSGHSVP